ILQSALLSTVQLVDVLISLQDWSEKVAHSTDPLKHHMRREGSRVNGASIQFFPGEGCRNRRMNWVSAQGIGCRSVASKAVLRIVNRHAASLVRRTMGEGNQVGIVRREQLSNRFDPSADAFEGVAGPERHKDVQPISPAGLGIPPDTCLFKCIVE